MVDSYQEVEKIYPSMQSAIIMIERLQKLINEIQYFKKHKKLRNFCNKKCIYQHCNFNIYKPKDSYFTFDNCNWCVL